MQPYSLAEHTRQSLTTALVLSRFRSIALHWDMDGTLVDSEPLHIEKLVAGAAQYGVELTHSHFASVQTFQVPDGRGGLHPVSMMLHGAGDKNIYQWLCTQRPELRETLDIQVWLDERQDYYLARAGNLQARAGVDQVVRGAAGAGATQCIVTSATHAQVEVARNPLLGILPFVSSILTADDVTRFKPEPECYLTSQARANELLRQRRVRAEQVRHIAIEDSPTGVRAALAAGLPCVHFVLPGASPFEPAPGQRLAVARASEELPGAIAKLMG